MAEDIASLLARLITSGHIESATLTVVLKPATVPPPQTDTPTCVFKIGPVSAKD